MSRVAAQRVGVLMMSVCGFREKIRCYRVQVLGAEGRDIQEMGLMRRMLRCKHYLCRPTLSDLNLIYDTNFDTAIIIVFGVWMHKTPIIAVPIANEITVCFA